MRLVNISFEGENDFTHDIAVRRVALRRAITLVDTADAHDLRVALVELPHSISNGSGSSQRGKDTQRENCKFHD